MRRREVLGRALAVSSFPLAGLNGCGGSLGLGAEAEVVSPPGPFTVPLERRQTHMSLAVRVNGQPLRFLLDTGADHNVLTPRTAQLLGLPLSTERVPSSGAEASDEPVPWTVVDDLAVGDALHLKREVAFVVPMPAEFDYDGILGATFWRAFSVRLDYGRAQATLAAPGRLAPSPAAVLLPLRVLPGGKMLVQATAAGQAGWFSVDTGDAGAVTLFRPVVERLGLRAALQPSVRMLTGVSVGGTTWADVARLPTFDIGPWQLPRVPVHLSLATGGLFGSDAWMGNLGGALWQRFAVTIDAARGALYLEPQAALAEPFAGPRSGLVARWTGERFDVLDVVGGSPAEQAGVRRGESLLAVQGRELAATDAIWLRTQLAGEPGTSVALRLRGASAQERVVTMVLRELV
ncbi:MAG: hypothetical protein EON49_08990 [Acidovorax sp.]|nr:MAG: hypothetical protein EON49_08990 [Acidovorax sp.]